MNDLQMTFLPQGRFYRFQHFKLFNDRCGPLCQKCCLTHGAAHFAASSIVWQLKLLETSCTTNKE